MKGESRRHRWAKTALRRGEEAGGTREEGDRKDRVKVKRNRGKANKIDNTRTHGSARSPPAPARLPGTQRWGECPGAPGLPPLPRSSLSHRFPPL